MTPRMTYCDRPDLPGVFREKEVGTNDLDLDLVHRNPLLGM